MLIIIFDRFSSEETVSLLRFWYQTQTPIPRIIYMKTFLVKCDQVQELKHSFKWKKTNTFVSSKIKEKNKNGTT